MPRPAPPPPARARLRRARLAAVAVAAAAAASDPLPESREEAVAQAAAAVAAQMAAPKGARNRKQRGSAAAAELALPGFAAAPKRLSVEIPVADESAAAAVALARELVAALPGALSRQFTVVAAGEGAGVGGAGAPVVAFARCLAEGRVPAGGLVVAAPTAAQAADVAALLADWRGAAVVVLNPGWAAAAANDALSPAYDFAQTFDPVYAFQPIVIAGLARAVVAEEGAVFRWARSGEPSAAPSSSSSASAGFGAGAADAGDDDLGAAPWRVYVRGKSGAWEPVARMRRRPGEAEVEAAFYNAAAAASPITKGAKWLRGLVDKKK